MKAKILKGCADALIYVLFLIAVLHFLVHRAEAKAIGYGAAPEQVRVKIGMDTIFRFPKAVQTITGASRLEIKPANPADPSYTVLAVRARALGASDVSFFLIDGSVVRAKIIAGQEEGDSLYDFRPEDALGSGESAPTLTEVELLKAMASDAEVSGYKVIEPESKELKEGVRIVLLRVYRGAPFNGYVYRLTNESSKSVEVDVRHVAVGEPNLALLAQADDATLAPKASTTLRIVAKNTASSRDVVFALEPKKEAQ